MSGASVDAIVIGAGAGGGIVAAELAQAGLRVALLDRGRNFTVADADDNELTGSHALYNQTGVQRFGPDATEFQTFRGDPGTPASKVYADDYRFSLVGWCVGGGTVSYQGLSWRFHPQTFRLKSLYGSIPGSTVEDWPITYDDLEPYYEKAEYELGICGEASPVGPRRRKPYPMRPLDDDREAQLLFPAARRLGWKPFHPPLAVTSEEYRGRPGCIRCSYCIGYLCEVEAKSSTAVTVIPQALKTGLCTLHAQAVVREITVDGRGRPNGWSMIRRQSPKGGTAENFSESWEGTRWKAFSAIRITNVARQAGRFWDFRARPDWDALRGSRSRSTFNRAHDINDLFITNDG